MRPIFIFVILASVLNFAAALRNILPDFVRSSRSLKPRKSSEEYWFTQYLNHFNPADDRVWKQRYFINNEYYKSGGPIFLFIGPESAASIFEIYFYQGQMFDEAKRFGAKMFLLEHRYYGTSQPTSDLSVDNLMYLNSQQALLDLAHFIEGMNKAQNLPKDTKWILFGLSYAGSLASWMRFKYPHLVHAAVSLSGPVLAQIDFQEFMSVIEASLKTHSQACIDAISNATNEMDKMMESPNGRKNLEELFNLCDPIDFEKTTKKDISNIYEKIAGNIVKVVQNNQLGVLISTVDICNIMVDEQIGAPVNQSSSWSEHVKRKEISRLIGQWLGK